MNISLYPQRSRGIPPNAGQANIPSFFAFTEFTIWNGDQAGMSGQSKTFRAPAHSERK
jgi:hypothetical protein